MKTDTSPFKEKIAQIKEKLRIKNPKVRKYVKRGLWTTVGLAVVGFLSLLTFFCMIYFGYYGKIPKADELKQIQNPIASEVYSQDGALLGKYYLVNRSLAKYKEIHPKVFDALVATEDARFFKHGGVDAKSLFRVLIKTVLLGDDGSGGGSTLSQQLAKNIYGRPNHGKLTMPINKIREMILAGRFENAFDKDEILALYLNTVSFGEDVFGIVTASERFFSTTPDKLEVQEAAMLIGMLKAPTSYNPRRNPERAKLRRNTVMEQMVKYRKLNSIKASQLKKLPLGLKYNRITQSDGPAPYFREHLRKELKEWCANNTKKDGSNYNLYTDGLKIYTTIDSRMQQYAEEAVHTHMSKLQEDFFKHWGTRKPWGTDDGLVRRAMKNSYRYKAMKEQGKTEKQIEKAFNTPVEMEVFGHNGPVEKKMSPRDSIEYYLMFLNAGFMVMDPKTAKVKAWVGGIDHKTFKYDHTQAKRQVGSTFKPIVYATALDQGDSPCKFVPNRLITYSEYQDWTPQNSDGEYGGSYSMRGALMGSVNVVTVQTIMNTGIAYVVEKAKMMGITTNVPEMPSIALGAAEIPLAEMMQVYSTLANGGTHIPPTYLLRIEDKKGRTIHKFKSNYFEKQEVFHPEDAYLMTELMQSVVDSGTARRLRFRYKLDNDIAGKTGTTQSQTDGWFMGYTPKLVAGAWVGGADRRVRFNSIRLGQGANMALPIWGEFFVRVNKDPNFKHIKEARFPEPSEEMARLLDCAGYLPYEIESMPWIAENSDSSQNVTDPVVNSPTKPTTYTGTLSDKGLTNKKNSRVAKPPITKKPMTRKAKRKQKRKNFWDKITGKGN